MNVSSTKFILNEYIPCQLAALSHSIMRALATVLEERFDISLPEWKVLAIIAEKPGLSGVAVARLAQMDTVAVSRAVTKLMDRELIRRELDCQDRRCSVLNLSSHGSDFYTQVIPIALELEAELLSELPDDVKLILKKAVQSLSAKSAMLAESYSEPPARPAAPQPVVNRLSAANRFLLNHPTSLAGAQLNKTASSSR